MTIPSITNIPNQDSPDTFAADADLCLQQLQAFADAINETVNYYNAATTAASLSSVTVATGNLSFTIATGLIGWNAGQPVTVNDSTNASEMQGQVVSYNSGTGVLVINVASFTGSGTFSNWSLSLGHPFLSKASQAEAVAGSDNANFMTAKLVKDVGTKTYTVSTGAVATGSTILPYDDTIPQSTEGDQYLSQTITPRSATSTLEIVAILNLANSAGTSGIRLTAALFQDSIANALACGTEFVGDIREHQVTVRFSMTSGTTSPMTFRVRAGGNLAGTTTLNGFNGNRVFGGALVSSLTIKEYL